MKRLQIIIIFWFAFTFAPQALAAEKVITIIHSNDMHSHFLGAPPNIGYTPSVTGDDRTIGGWARIATVIKKVKQDRSNPVLVVDAGDFLMGSLFHMLSREQAFELRLLSMMGYDAVCLGNPIEDLKRMRIDADRQKPGIQELKEWKAVIAYIQSFSDTDADGLPNVPDKYRDKLGRNVAEASWNPYQLLKRGNYITWLTFAALSLGVFILLGIVRFLVKKVG